MRVNAMREAALREKAAKMMRETERNFRYDDMLHDERRVLCGDCRDRDVVPWAVCMA